MGTAFAAAQTIIERAAFPFDVTQDTCVVRASIGNAAPLALGDYECECGVVNEAIHLDGDEDIFIGGSDVDNIFRKIDFSISFYFKVEDQDAPEPMVILSSQDSCSSENRFSIIYRPSTRIVTVNMIENANNVASLLGIIPGNNCWNYIVVTRNNTTTNLYANGELLESKNASGGARIDLGNDDNVVKIGSSTCNTPSESRFVGFLDELRFFQNAMSAEQVRNAYLAPEKIGNGKFSIGGIKDTTIFLGGEVEGFITSKCPDVDIVWTPSIDILQGTDSTTNPIITPQVTRTYTATFSDAFCTTTDSLLINVVDPADLDCTQLFIPTAFTPNGDNLNDQFGITNSVVITELYTFEIFDRWGNLVFMTDDKNATWDGTYRGNPVNSNAFLYKIAYRCKEEDLTRTGTVTIMR